MVVGGTGQFRETTNNRIPTAGVPAHATANKRRNANPDEISAELAASGEGEIFEENDLGETSTLALSRIGTLTRLGKNGDSNRGKGSQNRR